MNKVEDTSDNAPEPTEAAKLLHGGLARGETHEQPEAVALPGDTLIASPQDDEDDDNF
jgi:hypothetical protein